MAGGRANCRCRLGELRDLLTEDLNTLERAQANVNNGTVRELHFQDHKVVLRLHYDTIRK